MNALILLVSMFVFVLSLGLQIQTSNNGNYLGAFFSSMLVAATQIGAFRVVHATTTWEFAAYLIGGPVGMVTSMYLYRRHARKVGANG